VNGACALTDIALLSTGPLAASTAGTIAFVALDRSIASTSWAVFHVVRLFDRIGGNSSRREAEDSRRRILLSKSGIEAVFEKC
jgi:hypothetical protein